MVCAGGRGTVAGAVTAYTLGDVARICGVSRRRLRYWQRTALVQRTRDAGSQPTFDFRDLVSVRSIVGLLDRGVPLRRIRRSAELLRARHPELDAIGALDLWEGSERVVVRHAGMLMELDGQLVLDFAAPRDGDVASLERGPVEGPPRRSAAAWFEIGCELDSEPETYGRAIEAYLHALEVDPDHADACCNLGSVYFNQDRRGPARECFERAIALVPGHVEANLNLGALLEEEGRDERALRLYRTALASDPLYPDTHVSLALFYEKLDLRRTALGHWRRYLQVDPAGAWADLARRRLSTH